MHKADIWSDEVKKIVVRQPIPITDLPLGSTSRVLDCDACFIPVDISKEEARKAICSFVGDTSQTCAYATSSLSYNGHRAEMRDCVLQLTTVESCGGLFSTAEAAVWAPKIAASIENAVVVGCRYSVSVSSYFLLFITYSSSSSLSSSSLVLYFSLFSSTA